MENRDDQPSTSKNGCQTNNQTNVDHSSLGFLQGSNSTAQFNGPVNITGKRDHGNMSTTKKFDEKKLMQYLKNEKVKFVDVKISKRNLTESMMKNLPVIVGKHIEKQNREEIIKKIDEFFEIEDLKNQEPLVFAAETGSGRTVLMKMVYLRCIQKGFIPFFISCQDIDASNTENISLVDFFLKYAINNCPIADSQGFFDWIEENQDKIFLIVDSLEQINCDLKPRMCNLTHLTTSLNWLKLLVSKEILKKINVFVSCRYSAINKMHYKPQKIYVLKGFSNIHDIVKFYKSEEEEKAKIVHLIKTEQKKGSKEFFRSPFVICQISLLTSPISSVTLTQIYDETFRRLKELKYHRTSHTEREKNISSIEINFMYFNMWMNGQIDGNIPGSKSPKISQIEDLSFVKVSSLGDSTSFKPIHRSLVEFHTACHLARDLSDSRPKSEFENIVNQLLNSKDEITFTMVRRFLCGLLFSQNNDVTKEKQAYFSRKFVGRLKKVLKNEKFDYQQQSYLNDVLEIKNIQDVTDENNDKILKKAKFEINLEKCYELDLLSRFLKKAKPTITKLSIVMPPDTTVKNMSLLIKRICKLREKSGRSCKWIKLMQLQRSFFTFRHIENLIQECKKKLELAYHESDAGFDSFLTKITTLHKSINPDLKVLIKFNNHAAYRL